MECFPETIGPSIYTFNLEFYAEPFWVWPTNTCEYPQRLCGRRVGARMTRFATQNPSNGRQRARGRHARSYFSISRSFK